ncbi:class I SAM-dependent methyltransferase [Abyssalbus ytuae]|uniref:Class I SAM-dependent methyltransferase n=1 Tax=Abyssalbus ytuae TaxID=2926907 RepID=A0A9E7D357_9FLAO|nr:class I SAM-dependent methyltransferase [Abyssalbus ytuae]UOB18923.1 class I SAM-dependent methyltransferase [Abyssalbus ytuae]
MKEALDKFSKQAATYKKFRPTYPAQLFDYIYSLCTHKNTAWDCGTGNGQVALELAKVFNKVFATDISEKQIHNAPRKENILYRVERAEKTSFPDNTFDLVTVAQALHWFDFNSFNQEVKRVLKPSGIVAVWGYSLLRINPEINKIIDNFYTQIIGEYWDKERKHVDSRYETINFNFEEINITQKFEIETQWTFQQLQGYFNSWSSVQNYMEKNNGHNPVTRLMEEINPFWLNSQKQIVFPVFVRIGKNVL